jgi:hypothetical protein
VVIVFLVVLSVASVAVIWAPLDAHIGEPGGPPPIVPNAPIDILPSSGTAPGCIVGTPGVPRPTFNLYDGVLQGNTYNVPNGTLGHVGMCYNAGTGAMFAYANWSHVGSGGGWFSYPQVTYGVNFWEGYLSTYTNQGPTFVLPLSVSAVVRSDDWFTTSYSINAPSPKDVDGYDLSLDDYFTETLPPEFEDGPFVEVEMFLAHNISYPFHYLHWQTLTLVNSTLAVEPWDIGWWCHGPTPNNGTNANVSFDLSFDGQATHGLAAATIGVNLSAVLAEVEALMPSVTCWTGPTDGFGSFYLDEANLGSEDGALGNTSFNYNWTVDSFCIHPKVDGTSAAGLICPDPAPSDLAPGPPAVPGELAMRARD